MNSLRSMTLPNSWVTAHPDVPSRNNPELQLSSRDFAAALLARLCV